MVEWILEQVQKRPLVTAALILLACFYAGQLTPWIPALVVCALASLIALAKLSWPHLSIRTARLRHIQFHLLLLILSVFSSWILIISNSKSLKANNIINFPIKARFIAILTSDFDPRPDDAWTVNAWVYWSDNQTTGYDAVLFGEGVFPAAQPGDHVIFLGKPFPPPRASNPGAFGNIDSTAAQAIGIDSSVGLICYTKNNRKCHASARADLLNRLRGGLSPHANSITAAMLLGAARQIPLELRDRFATTGTSHLLAISGLHLAWVATLIFLTTNLILNRFPRLLLRGQAKKIAWVCTTVGCVLFTLATGAHTPTVRACCMVALLAWATVFDHDADVLTWWAAAALVIVAWAPTEAMGASFQLSFAAVLGLVVSARTFRVTVTALGWDDPVRFRWRRWGLGTVFSCFAAWTATLPISIYHFGFVSLGAPLINCVVVPYVTAVWMPCSVCGLLLVILGPSTTEWVGLWLIQQANDGLLFVLDQLLYFSNTITLGRPQGWMVLTTTVVIIVFLGGPAFHRRIRFFAAAVFVIVMAWFIAETRQPAHLRITFLDVGHGDAIIVECPGANPVLVDGGGTHRNPGGPGRYAVIPSLHAMGISSLHAVVNTHADTDHIGGLPGVLQRRKVEQLWWNGRMTASTQQLILLSTSILSGIDPLTPYPARTFAMGECNIEILAPPPPGRQIPAWSQNELSLVLRITYGQHRFLLTGDIEKNAELLLRSDPDKLRADVVKVAHHGSKTSSSPEFIDATHAKLAVVSCDQNARYGLPDEEVIERWEHHGARVLRTDMHGAVTVESDGMLLWISMAQLDSQVRNQPKQRR